MDELFAKLHALSEDRQAEVVEQWLEGINNAGEYNGFSASSMIESAKNELMMGDYEDFHFYARKNGGGEAAIKAVIDYVKEEDEDSYEDFLEELSNKISD